MGRKTDEIGLQGDWYTALIEECKAIITEKVFQSRWALVEGHWQLGKTVRESRELKKFAKGSKTYVQRLARNIGISERTLYSCLECFDKYPKLENIPEGKNISWNKIITKYLPAAPTEDDPHIKDHKKWLRALDKMVEHWREDTGDDAEQATIMDLMKWAEDQAEPPVIKPKE